MLANLPHSDVIVFVELLKPKASLLLMNTTTVMGGRLAPEVVLFELVVDRREPVVDRPAGDSGGMVPGRQKRAVSQNEDPKWQCHIEAGRESPGQGQAANS